MEWMILYTLIERKCEYPKFSWRYWASGLKFWWGQGNGVGHVGSR